MPRGWGTSLWRRTVPAMALSLVLLVVGADVPAASGNAPRPASPWGGVARNPGTPKRTERPAGPAIQPAASVRPQQVGEPAEWVLTFHDEFDGSYFHVKIRSTQKYCAPTLELRFCHFAHGDLGIAGHLLLPLFRHSRPQPLFTGRR